MGKYEDFTWVGKVTGSQKYDRATGGPKFKIQTEGAGPDEGRDPTKPRTKNIWLFQQDRDGNEQSWWPLVQKAILENNVLVFDGYKEETQKSTPEKPAFYWNGTNVKLWDGSATVGAAQSETAAPAPSLSRADNQIQVQPPAPVISRIDQTPGEIARWAVGVVVGSLDHFDEVPEDARERAKYIEVKATALTKLAANVEKRITESD